VALAAHREAFYVALQQHYNAIDDKKVKIKSRAEYEELISFLKSPGCKDKNTRKTKNHLLCQAALHCHEGNAIGQRDYLVSKSELDKAQDAFSDVDALKVRQMAATVFDIIREHHLLKDHFGKRITWESVKECYSNISHDICGLYCALCQCTVNQCSVVRRASSPFYQRLLMIGVKWTSSTCNLTCVMGSIGSCIIT
jgi:hypothetical protein